MVNIALVIAFLVVSGIVLSQDQYSKAYHMSDVLEAYESGAYPEAFKQKMKEDGTFLMEIDDAGHVTDSVNLPAELNHDYSRAQIASFTRWYLEDHMVITQVLDNGRILVYGYPEGEGLRYNLIGNLTNFLLDALILPFLLTANLVLFLILQWRREKKLERAILPVLDEVHHLSKGEAVDLPVEGPLSEVNRELNEASSRLTEREVSRVEWITGISHDIRTPLSIIRGSAEILDEGIDSPEVREAVDKIERNACRIESMMTSLSLNSKLDYGFIPARKQVYPAASLFRDILSDYLNEHPFDRFDLDIRIAKETENFDMIADPDLIARLVSNLLDNIERHNPEGCPVRIELSVLRKKGLLFDVRDYGAGADEETLARLNEPVVRDGYGYHKHGLGILIVKKIAKNHDADFLFRGEDPGFRAQIWFPKNS